MQNYLEKKLIIASLIFFVELICIGTIFALKGFVMLESYLYDIILSGVIIILSINYIYLLVIFVQISKAKLKSDVSTLGVLGSDVKDIYEFGKIGLIVVDDKDKIIWTNDWLNNNNFDFIGEEILYFNPNLIELKKGEEGKEIVIEVNGRKYCATYKASANLYILKDVTNIEDIKKYNDTHSPVIGIINIDNYQDLVSIVDDGTLNEMLLLVQSSIAEYAKKFNLCLRKYKTDSYLVICSKESFEKAYNDKFSLTEIVKKYTEEQEQKYKYKLTISMGFAYGQDDFNKLSEMAISSLNFALSRGGDQVVVFPYGKNYIFFGGNSESKLTNSQSSVRVLAQTLADCIKNSNDVYIMGHNDADLDAIGSSLGLYYFAKTYKEKVKIIFSEELMENKARSAFKQTCSQEDLKLITISPQEAIENIKKNSLLILTDVHQPSRCMSPELVEKASKIAVIDHHRRTEEFVEKPVFKHIESVASSACEIVTEFIHYCKDRIEISPKSATLMLSGILLDTNNYRNKTSGTTYDASRLLKDFGADNDIASSFLKEDYNEYLLKTKIKGTVETIIPGIVLCRSDDDYNIDRSMLAIVAQELLNIQGIKACFVIGRIGDNTIGISGRSDGTINCQVLMEKFNGGGHFVAAAAQIVNSNVEAIYDDVKNQIKELNDRLSEIKGDA